MLQIKTSFLLGGGQEKKQKPERVTPYDSTSLVQEENFLLKYWRIKFSCLLRLTAKLLLLG